MPARAVVPPGFTERVIARVGLPTALAVTPDGRLLVATQAGILRVVENGALLAAPALDLSAVTCTNSERGMLGIALAPDFALSQQVYLYYTFNRNGSCATGTGNPTPVNRVSRFTLPASSVIDPASERVVLDHIPSVNGYHNAGGLAFGADGYLYIGCGDNGVGANARRPESLNGKILRVDVDGLPPPGNPWSGHPGARRCGDPAGVPPGSGPCAEVVATGLRNPYRLAFRPGTNELRIGDVGAQRFEEINEGEIGANYGWDSWEGPCPIGMTTGCGAPPAGIRLPLFSYDHADGCASVTGAVFLPAGAWPAPWDGAYLFADWGCGRIFRLLDVGGGEHIREDFASGYLAASLSDIAFGPDGSGGVALYAADMNGGSNGEIIEIRSTPGANRPPSAALSAAPDFGPPVLRVAFDASASRDPDADPLSWDFDFGDGQRELGRSSPATSHDYLVAGVYTATAVAHDGRGGSSTPAAVRIDVGNSPPVPAITAPGAAQRFAVGETVLLTGSAVDPEDGPLADSSLTWSARFVHVPESMPANSHAHPFLAPVTGNGIAIRCPEPEDLDATRFSHLELELRAVDSLGREAIVTRTFDPNRVDLSFTTTPAGLDLLLAGERRSTPLAALSWEGFALTVAAPPQLDALGNAWTFASWSDSGGMSHAIATPATAASWNASFRSWPDPGAAPNLLRNDELAELNTAAARRSAIFTGAAPGPSLEMFGADRLAGPGEGVLLANNGSADDDDFYVYGLAGPLIEPESAVRGDGNRPLVFYQLDRDDRVLDLIKVGGGIGIVPR